MQRKVSAQVESCWARQAYFDRLSDRVADRFDANAAQDNAECRLVSKVLNFTSLFQPFEGLRRLLLSRNLGGRWIERRGRFVELKSCVQTKPKDSEREEQYCAFSNESNQRSRF